MNEMKKKCNQIDKLQRKEKTKQFFSKLWGYIKRPPFVIGFLVTWCLFASPTFYGFVMYFLTKNGYYLALAFGWWALIAPPLPIPVVPISVAAGVAVERIFNKIKEKKNGRSEK